MAKTRTLSIILLTALLSSGCTSGALSLLTGGGPNVAANTQIGRENNQGVNTSITTTSRPELRPEGPVDTIVQDNSTTNISPLVLLLLIIGWLAPSPSEMGRGLMTMIAAIRGKRNDV
jgi:PBP1b-binding outer membrane lipoprotein LpoB